MCLKKSLWEFTQIKILCTVKTSSESELLIDKIKINFKKQLSKMTLRSLVWRFTSFCLSMNRLSIYSKCANQIASLRGVVTSLDYRAQFITVLRNCSSEVVDSGGGGGNRCKGDTILPEKLFFNIQTFWDPPNLFIILARLRKFQHCIQCFLLTNNSLIIIPVLINLEKLEHSTSATFPQVPVHPL